MELPTAIIKPIINQLRLAAMLNVTCSEDELVPKMKIDDEQDVDVLDLVVSKLFPDYEDVIAGSINVPVVPSAGDEEIVEESNMLDSDIIKSSDDKLHVRTWLEEVNKASKPELLYRASRDGWAKSEVHSKCDNKGATLTIAKTSKGYVFGGYSDVPWTSHNDGDWKSSEEAFLFSLKCHAGLAPTKMNLKPGNNEYAVLHSSNSGASFGSGHDLCIGYNGSDLKIGYSSIGNAYKLPNGASNTFLTGKVGLNDLFEVSEVEVFRV